MTDAVLGVERLAPADWWMLRATRLRALRDSPDAYTSEYSVEAAWDDGRWQRLLEANTWVVAVDRGRLIGIAGLVGGEGAHSPPHVEGVWVEPGHRRRGVLRSLIDDLAERARDGGLSTLLLWVLEDNQRALAAYERLGFLPIGMQPIRPGDDRHEVRLLRGV